MCTCPEDLAIHSDGLNCVTEETEEDEDYGGDFTTITSENTSTPTVQKEFDLTVTDVEVLTTTEEGTDLRDETTEAGDIVNRIGITQEDTTKASVERNVSASDMFET